MIDWLVEVMRGKSADDEKARRHVRQTAAADFRRNMAGYDAFIPYMERIEDPSILIGTTKSSSGVEIPVRVGLRESHAHTLIQGSTGTGKTSFATATFVDRLRLGDPTGLVDCKSGFFEVVLSWIGAWVYLMDPSQRQSFMERLAVINPFADRLVPLNLCRPLTGIAAEVQAYDICLSFSRLFSADVSFQMENLLRHLILLLIEANLSLVEAPEILQNDLVRDILVYRSANPVIKEFFGRAFPTVPQSSKNALLTRIQSLLVPENLRLMLGADQLIDFRTILDHGDPLLIFLGKGPGVPEEQVDLIGSLILQLLFQAAYSSESGKRRPYQIVLDEFFHLLDAPALEKRFDTALTSLRSFGVNLSLVMHNFSQVSPALRDSILNNCDFMAIFRSSSRNAHYFGDFLPDADPALVAKSLRGGGQLPTRSEVREHLLERLQRLPDRHCYWYDKRKPYRGLLVRVPELSAPHRLAGISEKSFEAFIESEKISLGGYGLPKDVLRTQVEARKKRLREMVKPPIRVRSDTDDGVSGDQAGALRKKKKPNLG